MNLASSYERQTSVCICETLVSLKALTKTSGVTEPKPILREHDDNQYVDLLKTILQYGQFVNRALNFDLQSRCRIQTQGSNVMDLKAIPLEYQ